MSKLVGFGLLVVGIIFLVLSCACMVTNFTTRDYIYRTEVRSHMENAYYSADPDTMQSEIVLARAGMENLGLTKDKYGAWLPWTLTPDNRMDWQYKHIDSILLRIDEFKSWESSQKTTGGGQISTSQQMQDVYTQKLDNVRQFIKNDGWSDDVAERAFAYNNYFFTTVCALIALLIGLPLFAISGFVLIVEYS